MTYSGSEPVRVFAATSDPTHSLKVWQRKTFRVDIASWAHGILFLPYSKRANFAQAIHEILELEFQSVFALYSSKKSSNLHTDLFLIGLPLVCKSSVSPAFCVYDLVPSVVLLIRTMKVP